MVQFQLAVQSGNTALYAAQNLSASQPYWFGYVSNLQAGATAPSTLSLTGIWDIMTSTAGNLPGDFVFAQLAPTSPQDFLSNFESFLSKQRQNAEVGFFTWLKTSDLTVADGSWLQGCIAYQRNAAGTLALAAGYAGNNSIAFNNLSLVFPAGATMALDETNSILSFTAQAPCTQGGPDCFCIHEATANLSVYGIKQSLQLNLDGPNAFTFAFPFTMNVLTQGSQNDFTVLDVAIKYFYTFPQSSDFLVQQSYPPFGAPANGSASVLFNVSLDPLYPTYSSRSIFLFAAGQTLISGYATDMGHQILLSPDGTAGAALVFHSQRKCVANSNTQVPAYYLAPSGNFLMSLAANDNTAAPNMTCGSFATESAGFVPASVSYLGDALIFYPNQNAHASLFPTGDNATAATPAQLLDNTYLTSWINIKQGANPPSKNNYFYSQPPASPLFSPKVSSSFLWYFQPVSRDLSSGAAGFCFPAAPYSLLSVSQSADAFRPADITNFELQVLYPARQGTLTATTEAPKRLTAGASDTPTTAVTPQGLLVVVDSLGTYTSLQLANNVYQGNTYNLQLENLSVKLIDALQSNQLLLIVTNAQNIGACWSPYSTLNTQPATGPAFENFMSIQGWPFVLNVGNGCAFGDYANVLIFKFCPGALSDMIGQPQQWTQATDFNNKNEVPAVSSWLQDYIADAQASLANDKAANKTSLYEYFVDVVTNPGWNGILCLKVDTSLTNFPPSLQGLLGAIDLSNFNAHHFGININQVTNNGALAMLPVSSMFGLIDYQDPAYVVQQQDDPGSTAPVQPRTGQTYDFKVLKLQVLFKNSLMTDFSSEVQITLNNLFGDNVSLPGGTYNSIVLQGSYQKHDNTPVYIFDFTGDNPFTTGGNLLTEIDIVKVQFNTLASEGDSSQVNARFSLWGAMHFAPLTGSSGPMDIFSFGDSAAVSGKGLSFSNLFIDMSFNLLTPSVKQMVFDSAHISFDTKQSAIRPGSFCQLFPLELSGFVTGDSTKTLASLNYLSVDLPQLATGQLGDCWNGLVFKINLGGPGALAGSLGFTSSFIIAWGTGSQGTILNAAAGIQLPGTSGVGNVMGFESVLKLAIGAIQLYYIQATAPAEPGFLLTLNNIALKFLGIAQLPPSGSTNCYVFGSPSSSGQANSLAWYAVYSETAGSGNAVDINTKNI